MERQNKKLLLAGQTSSSFTLILLLLMMLPGTLAWTVIETMPESKARPISRLLSASYALLCAISLIQLARIQLRESGWTTPKIFHLTIFTALGVRAVFGCHMFVLKPKVFTSVLLDLPILLFNSAYFSTVLFFYDSYKQTEAHNDYIITNCAFCIQVIPLLILSIYDNFIIEFIGQLLISVLSLIAAFIMAHYRWINITTVKLKWYKVDKVRCVTAIFITSFLIRGTMVLLSTFITTFVTNASFNVMDNPILCIFYYMLAEILPSALALYNLR